MEWTYATPLLPGDWPLLALASNLPVRYRPDRLAKARIDIKIKGLAGAFDVLTCLRLSAKTVKAAFRSSIGLGKAA